MCTVSYLPLDEGGFILTSNRDEAPLRNAIEVRVVKQSGQTLIYPEDPGAKGSWVAGSNSDRAGCLLNGAFEPFTMGPQFTHSRGHVLLDAVRTGEISTDPALLKLTAPFTLVVFDHGTFSETVWDGKTLHHKDLDPTMPGFWSSVTLYPEKVRKWRRALFNEWVEQQSIYNQSDIIEFHKYGSEDDEWNGFVMNRDNRVRTLSITSIKSEGDELNFKYSNLLTGRDFEKTLAVLPHHDMASD